MGKGADWPVGPGERYQDSEGTFGSKSNRDHCGGYSRGSWEVAWGLRALPVLPAQNLGSRVEGFSWRVWGGARGECIHKLQFTADSQDSASRRLPNKSLLPFWLCHLLVIQPWQVTSPL